MKRTLIVRPDVKAEVNRVASEYERLTPGTGRRFDLSVLQIFDRIAFMPKMFEKLNRRVRIAPVRKFPFAVLCVVTRNAVEVFALIPTRSNPMNWPLKP